MQDITKELSFNKEAMINFLPVIDLNRGDESCIYSTLKFITEEANKFGILVPCVVFDQPLWLKAIRIIAESGLKTVARLGAFHTTMSFLGKIGKLMVGLGIAELLAEVYGENSVEHMLSRKAVSRSLRGHFLVKSSLKDLLFDLVAEDFDIDAQSLKEFVEQMEKEKDLNSMHSFLKSRVMLDINSPFEEISIKLEHQRTLKVWLL